MAKVVPFVLLLALAGCEEPTNSPLQQAGTEEVAGAVQQTETEEVAGSASATQDTATRVSGTIKLKGDVPQSQPIKIRCSNCRPLYPDGMPSEDLVVDKEKHVQWAFVYVKAGVKGKKFDIPKNPVVLDQRGCRHKPHVLGMMAGQKLVIRNSDPHFHQFHAMPFKNKVLMFGQPQNSQDVENTFEHREIMIKMRDDVHPWMSAWIGVLDHPFFAVSGRNGKYEIKGLPPGKYTLEVWHEKYKSVTQEIEVRERERSIANFVLEIRKH